MPLTDPPTTPAAGVLAGDLPTVLTTLQAGLGQAEHAALVERLQAKKKQPGGEAGPETAQ